MLALRRPGYCNCARNALHSQIRSVVIPRTASKPRPKRTRTTGAKKTPSAAPLDRTPPQPRIARALDNSDRTSTPGNVAAAKPGSNPTTSILELVDPPITPADIRAVSHLAKSRDAVTRDTPIATHELQVRGVLALALRQCYTHWFLSGTPQVHRCDFFTAWYVPPWHVLALSRKSRPAFVPLFGDGSEFNGDATMVEKCAKGELLVRRSKNPMLYAHARKHMGKLGRRSLWNAFVSTPGSVDGVYIFKFHKFPWPNPQLAEEKQPGEAGVDTAAQKIDDSVIDPLDLDDLDAITEYNDLRDYDEARDAETLVARQYSTRFDREMAKMVASAAQLATKPMPWVAKFNNKVGLRSLNEALSRNKLFPLLTPVEPGDMLHWTPTEKHKRK